MELGFLVIIRLLSLIKKGCRQKLFLHRLSMSTICITNSYLIAVYIRGLLLDASCNACLVKV